MEVSHKTMGGGRCMCVCVCVCEGRSWGKSKFCLKPLPSKVVFFFFFSLQCVVWCFFFFFFFFFFCPVLFFFFLSFLLFFSFGVVNSGGGVEGRGCAVVYLRADLCPPWFFLCVLYFSFLAMIFIFC